MTLLQSIIHSACLFGLSSAVQAQYCNSRPIESTQSAEFIDNNDGTVSHSRTGLMWKRCAQGQDWNGTTCTGYGSEFLWRHALQSAVRETTAAYTDWRLPNIKELESIVDDKCNSSINSIFLNSPARRFWSASPGDPYRGTGVPNSYARSFAWAVDFATHEVIQSQIDFDTNYFAVRLVRAGHAFASFDSFDTVALTVVKTGAGTVGGNPIDCGNVCSGKAGRGFAVKLTATPAANLLAWGDDCARAGNSATCIVNMDAAKSVTATFKNTPLISGLPGALTFVLQNVGSTSPPQNVTLKNTGTAALGISSIDVTGDFTVTHNCGNGLGAGGFCEVQITFRPTVSGARNGSVAIASDAIGSPHNIVLSGSGRGGTVEVNTIALNFEARGVGTSSAAQTVSLSNKGVSPLIIASIETTGDFNSTTNCGANLVQGGSCSINVRFAPSVLGARTGRVIITSDAPYSPHSIALSGYGERGTGEVSPRALGFSSQGMGTISPAQTVILRNTGVALLNIGSIVVSGDFSRTTNCGATLAIGANCSISVTFSPTVIGAHVGTLVISSDATNSPSSINLTGSAVASPVVSLSRTALNFVPPNGGTSNLTQTVTLTNTGTALLSLTSITSSGDFSLTHNCGAGLGAGGICTLTVAFRPVGTANAAGAILIMSNAPGSPHTVTLSSGSTAATNVDKVFAWAEKTYPHFFSPANGASLSITGYRYRAYNGGGYLAASDSAEPHLLYIGPLSGGTLVDLGLLTIWLAQVGP